jgi:hypothetical protein
MIDVIENLQLLPFVSTRDNNRRLESCIHEKITAKYAADILKNSFTIVKAQEPVQRKLRLLADAFESIDQHTRDSFCFVKRTDGFMPSGLTFARDLSKTDLCRTFNYWYHYRQMHREYQFSQGQFYRTISECEVDLYNTTQAILDEIAYHYNYSHSLNLRGDSYVQFNMYPDAMKRADRKYLQDIHEDGHVLTYVKPNAPGLLIYINGKEHLINLQTDEAIVMAGSLLTELPEGDVPPLYHAVLDLNLPAARASLIYNANCLYSSMRSFKGRLIPMTAIANQHHAEFGQHPYHSS